MRVKLLSLRLGITALLLTLLSSSSSGGPVFSFGIEEPPEKYKPSEAVATTFIEPSKEVARLCSKGHDYIAMACSTPRGNRTGIVIMPTPCDPAFRGEFYADLYCHELSHLNGWVHKEQLRPSDVPLSDGDPANKRQSVRTANLGRKQ